MWTFPLVSIFLSFLLWKEKVSKAILLTLAFGLTLQGLAFNELFHLPLHKTTYLVAFGKGLLIGVLYFYFGFDLNHIDAERRDKMRFKFFLLVAMVFLTLANFYGERVSEATAVVSLILFPALFWKRISSVNLADSFSFLAISILSFFSFIFKWSELFSKGLDLTPLIWMVSFALCFYLVGNLKELK